MAQEGIALTLKGLPAEQRRVIRGWCVYDWANSAFATSVGTAIVPVYFVTLFKDALGDETDILGFTLTGSSMWSLGIAVSTAIVAFSSPLLGAIADRAAIKKALLRTYALAGALFTVLSFFSAYTAAPWAWLFGCFILGNIGFAGGNVFYNSLLPHIAPRELLDDVSSRGFAYGYVGGGLLLAIHLAFILAFRDTSQADLVTRLAIASVGFWWFGWALWTFKTVPEPRKAERVRGLTPGQAARIAFSEAGRTLRQLVRFRMLAIYLAAYLLFNDGIQTVLTVAGAFGSDTLGVSLIFNITTILVVQFIAALGAMLAGRLAGRIGAKRTLAIALAGWCGVIALAVGFAPLEPKVHANFDYQLDHTAAGVYAVTKAPDLSDNKRDEQWVEAQGRLWEVDTISRSRAEKLADAVSISEDSRFSISIEGGPLSGARNVGPRHPSNLTQGPIDSWPRALRGLVWSPLGISINLQWLALGALLGIVMGGSQALARSLYAYMTPESKSTEFFGFFAFVGRASSVFGPMVYLVFTGIYDTRMAILVILVIIMLGTSLLRWVDVEQGRSVAVQEDERQVGI